MESYDWAWVEEHVDRTTEVWTANAGGHMTVVRSYTSEQQRVNEEIYDEGLAQVEETLAAPSLSQEHVVSAFARFSATALGLDEQATAVLTDGFLPVGVSLASWARRFDPSLSMAGIVQATRNAWTACGLQPLLGVPLALTPSILGYSLLYPYSDNFLDDEEISGEDKLRFSYRFRQRLTGEALPPEDQRERSLWALIALVEKEYARAQYPGVFECMLAIHKAQERSVVQVRNGVTLSDAECLRLSCAKGGSSVLADACLAYGSMTPQESRFAFEWGVLLQLGDDLQDVREDMRNGSMTLFSREAAAGRLLDARTIQLLRFSDHVGRLMDEMQGGSPAFKALLAMSWRSLIVGAVADSSDFFSVGFLLQAERISPFRFEFLRARKARLVSHQGLYAALFSALLNRGEELGTRLPSPVEWARLRMPRALTASNSGRGSQA